MTISQLSRRAAILFVCTLLTLGCSRVETDKIPTYTINFWSNDSQTLTQDITFTRIQNGAPVEVLDFSNIYVSAAGEDSKPSLFGNDEMEQSFPNYCQILLLPAGTTTYSLGGGAHNGLRFRFETAHESNTILDVERDDRWFWINESDIYDNYGLISEGKIHIQYMKDDDNDGILEYFSASEGTATLIEKHVVPYDSLNGEISLEIDFDNVLFNIDGGDFLLNGTVDLNMEVTDNER